MADMRNLWRNYHLFYEEEREWDYFSVPFPDVPRSDNPNHDWRTRPYSWRDDPPLRCQPDNLKPERTYIRPVGMSEEQIQRGVEQIHADREEWLRTGKLPKRIRDEMDREEFERQQRRIQREAAKQQRAVKRWLAAEQRWRKHQIALRKREMADIAHDCRRAMFITEQRHERDVRREQHERKREAVSQTASKRTTTRKRLMNWQPPADSYDRRPWIPSAEQLALPPLD